LEDLRIADHQVRDPILDASQLAQLTVTPKDSPFDGNSLHFKLGVEAARLRFAEV
jgi:hypothetical protein